MKAIICNEFASVDKLEYQQVADPKAGKGAAGGTGLAAVQIGKAMGAKVIAVCSTQEKLDMAKQNGADILINYTEQDLKTAIKEVTNGRAQTWFTNA